MEVGCWRHTLLLYLPSHTCPARGLPEQRGGATEREAEVYRRWAAFSRSCCDSPALLSIKGLPVKHPAETSKAPHPTPAHHWAGQSASGLACRNLRMLANTERPHSTDLTMELKLSSCGQRSNHAFTISAKQRRLACSSYPTRVLWGGTGRQRCVLESQQAQPGKKGVANRAPQVGRQQHHATAGLHSPIPVLLIRLCSLTMITMSAAPFATSVPTKQQSKRQDPDTIQPSTASLMRLQMSTLEDLPLPAKLSSRNGTACASFLCMPSVRQQHSTCACTPTILLLHCTPASFSANCPPPATARPSKARLTSNTHGQAHVRFLERRRVVGAVACHRHHLALPL
jgi:hypothetical protein